jgi:sulfopyruvate decarboxylase subunit alpha
MQPKIAGEILSSLKEAGVDFIATLTEANLHDLVMLIGEDRSVQHVPVTREEEGIGICAGAYLGGKSPAMVMMNAGFLLSANALATVSIHPGIPVLMLIGHSGGIGEENPGHATVGMLTEPILQGLHVMYEKVGRFDEIRPAIKDSQMLARSSRRPVAILLNKEALR